MPAKTLPFYYDPLGFQKLVVSGTAVGFTNPIDYAGKSIEPSAVSFICETDQIRFRVDGIDPDASTGVLVEKGDLVELTNPKAIKKFKAIKVTNDATLQIHYFGGY